VACSDPKAYDSKTTNAENANTANGHVIDYSKWVAEKYKTPGHVIQNPKSQKHRRE